MSEETVSGPDLPPDRLAISPRSPYFDEEKLMRGIGIRFKGVVRKRLMPFSISPGAAGVALGGRGVVLCSRLGLCGIAAGLSSCPH